MSQQQRNTRSSTPDREPLLTVDDLAEYTGLPVKTIYALNHEGRGPTRVKLGRRVMYRPRDVDAWIDAQVVHNTTTP